MKFDNTANSSSQAGMELYQDETLAMVYVGDVYSLVAQDSAATSDASSIDRDDSNDTLLPFIR